jgi:hypothetical protein
MIAATMKLKITLLQIQEIITFRIITMAHRITTQTITTNNNIMLNQNLVAHTISPPPPPTQINIFQTTQTCAIMIITITIQSIQIIITYQILI